MTGKTKKIENDELDATQIEAWLKQNPGFFIGHPSSLSAMELPVDAGPAISLHQYQVRVLQEDKKQLKQKLGILVKNVKTNHKIHSDLLDLAGHLIILAKQNADIDTYLAAIRKYFSLFKILYLDSTESAEQFKTAKKILGKRNSACENKTETEILQNLFYDDAPAVLSYALVPIKQDKKCVAYLILAADDAERFKPGMGGEFLKLLARLVANLSNDAK